MIVFFDTNVWVSAVATRGLCADIVRVGLMEHQLIAGPTVLAELRQVLREKLRLPQAAISEVEAFVRLHATIVPESPPSRMADLSRDDCKILGEAVAGHADVLVTGDQDFLRIAGHVPLKILSPRGFWELLRKP